MPQPTDHDPPPPFRALALGSLPYGAHQEWPDQGWEKDGGRAEWGEDPKKGSSRAPSPLGPGTSALLGLRGPCPCRVHAGFCLGSGLDGASTLLGSGQKRPRCVYRPDRKAHV